MVDKTKTVLIVEDEQSLREMLEMALKKSDYKLKIAATFREGSALLESGGIDIVLTDVKLPDGSGIELMTKAKSMPERPPVIVMTAFGTTDMAVEAMKLGAFHYLTKPFKLEELKILLTRALEEDSLKKENILLKKEAQKEFSLESMVGSSKKIKDLFEMIERVSNTKTNVLITGESGTGKELIARAIHYGGSLKSKPFVTINCGAIPESLMESEMFGHKRGSFTGAVSDKDGLFQIADTGTIFLDEVGELPPSIQVKLLRVLQDRSFRPVGGTESMKVDVRIIAATNRNLEEAVAKGEFREDLYYRLNVINIQSPSLRSRKEDIPQLVEHFLRKYSLGMGKNITKISSTALNLLMDYDFPGNIRELQNIMERAVALEGRAEITVDSLPPNVRRQSTSSIKTNEILTPVSPAELQEAVDLEKIVGDLEKQYILLALQKSGGIKKDAAKLLGITFRSFRYRLEKYGIADAENSNQDEEI